VISMNTFKARTLLLITLAAASVGPLIFPAAQSGHGNMTELAEYLLWPAVVVLSAIALLSRKSLPTLGGSIVWGGLAGAAATVGLEAVRLTGLHFGYMPGNLPRLMGVLLLNRFALGPSLASDVVGWAYHFWNGASFGIIYVLVFGAARRWAGVLYGIAVALGFLTGPVVLSLGVGYFGLQFSKGFPVTVLAAHAVFGFMLGVLARRFLRHQESAVWATVRSIFRAEVPQASPAQQ
jgi:hypothetical protein